MVLINYYQIRMISNNFRLFPSPSEMWGPRIAAITLLVTTVISVLLGTMGR